MCKKILIKTGSHYSNKEWNRQQFSKINKVLFNEEENPFYKFFNEERLFLDDTNGFISIAAHSYDDYNFCRIAKKLAKYLLDNIAFDGPSNIYIGNCIIEVK